MRTPALDAISRDVRRRTRGDAKSDLPMKVLGGYNLGPRGELLREKVDTNKPGDYGADPLGNGMFKMVPSGDIVNHEERNRRLKK